MIFRLEGSCLSIIKNYTAAEVKDVNLNGLLKTHCADVIDEVSVLLIILDQLKIFSLSILGKVQGGHKVRNSFVENDLFF